MEIFSKSGDAHTLRLLRNLLHDEHLHSDKEALEALSGASDILNKLFLNSSNIPYEVICTICKHLHESVISPSDELGVEKEIGCKTNNYRQKFKMIIMP